MDAEVQDLIQTVEKAFDVKFDADELHGASTFEDLCNALKRHFDGYESDRCFTAICFWRLRRATSELLHMPKESITRGTPVESLAAPLRRQQFWQHLSRNARLRLPRLQYPMSVASGIVACALIPAVLAYLGISSIGGWWTLPAAALSVVLFAVAVLVLYLALKLFAFRVPPECAVFGELAQATAGLNENTLARETASSREREMINALRRLIAAMYDLDPYHLRHDLQSANPTLHSLAFVANSDAHHAG